MIAIIDYDAGNLKSVEKALQSIGEDTIVSRDREEILRADKVILPGVGSFGDAMQKLRDYKLDEVIKEVTESGKPFLGICLGLQLLFERSEETPGVDGLLWSLSIRADCFRIFRQIRMSISCTLII